MRILCSTLGRIVSSVPTLLTLVSELVVDGLAGSGSLAVFELALRPPTTAAASDGYDNGGGAGNALALGVSSGEIMGEGTSIDEGKAAVAIVVAVEVVLLEDTDEIEVRLVVLGLGLGLRLAEAEVEVVAGAEVSVCNFNTGLLIGAALPVLPRPLAPPPALTLDPKIPLAKTPDTPTQALPPSTFRGLLGANDVGGGNGAKGSWALLLGVIGLVGLGTVVGEVGEGKVEGEERTRELILRLDLTSFRLAALRRAMAGRVVALAPAPAPANAGLVSAGTGDSMTCGSEVGRRGSSSSSPLSSSSSPRSNTDLKSSSRSSLKNTSTLGILNTAFLGGGSSTSSTPHDLACLKL